MANVPPPVEAAEGSMEREKDVLRVAVLQVFCSKSVTGSGRRARPCRGSGLLLELVKVRTRALLAVPWRKKRCRKTFSADRQRETERESVQQGRKEEGGGGRGCG